MGTPASLLDLIAHGGAASADIANTRALTEHTRAATSQAQEATRTQAQATRAADLENQAREVTVRDNGIIRDAMTQVQRGENESSADYLGRITDHTRKNGVSAGGYTGLLKTLGGALETQSKLAGDTLAQHKEQVAMAGPLLQSLATAAPENQDAVYAQIQPQLSQLEPGHFPSQLPADPAQRKMMIDTWNASHGVNAALLGMKKTGADIAHTDAQTAGQQATTAGTLQSTANAAAMQPSALAKSVADAQHAEQVAGGTVPIQPHEQAQLDAAAAVAAETKAQHGATNAHEEARIGIESRKEAREQSIYQQTYGEGANEALRGVEPKLRIPATKAAQSAADEHLKANRTADEMENFIQLARQGNKAAYANIPVAGVLEITTSNGVSRINKNELEAFGGAGSLFDKLSGALGKGASGASISKSVLDDIEKMHQSIRAGSDKAYNDKLTSINQNYHAGFKVTPSTHAPGLSTGHKIGDVVNVGGKNYKITKVLPGDKFEGDEVKQ